MLKLSQIAVTVANILSPATVLFMEYPKCYQRVIIRITARAIECSHVASD